VQDHDRVAGTTGDIVHPNVFDLGRVAVETDRGRH